MKMAVATMERAESRAIPQMPWPEVQPPPSRVPNPTYRPAATVTVQLAGICGDGMAYPTQLPMSGARMSPAIKAMRQPLSFIPKPRQPPNIPLMPAIRPVNSINNAAERPISAPPIAAETGVKLAMTLPCDPCPPAFISLSIAVIRWERLVVVYFPAQNCALEIVGQLKAVRQ